MATPKIIIDGRINFVRRLNTIRERSGNLRPVLLQCGEIIQSSIEENFLQEGRFESATSWRGGTNRWEDLAPATKKSRQKKGKWPGKKLQMSQGGLAASIGYNVVGNDLEIGTNKPYAAIQQLGGMAGRGKKVRIPARPYIVVQDEDLDDMMEVAEQHIIGD